MNHILRILLACATLGLAFPASALDPGSVDRKLVSRDNNVQIEVLSQGSGPTIVLLPSLGRSGEDYNEVAAKLAASGFRVVRPQPRGIGRSKGPMENLNMHDLAADVAAVLDKEVKGPVVVVGCDFTDEVHEVAVIRHGTMQVDVRPVAPPQDAFWRMLDETARERHNVAERRAEL